jgi:hypothetical protein
MDDGCVTVTCHSKPGGCDDSNQAVFLVFGHRILFMGFSVQASSIARPLGLELTSTRLQTNRHGLEVGMGKAFLLLTDHSLMTCILCN